MKIVRLLLLLAVLAAGFAVYRLAAPYQGFGSETFVDIPHGASSSAIAEMLARAGVIRGPWDFFLPRVLSRGRKLQAGEYRFNRPATVMEVYDRIARGDVFYYELVVPEGKNMFDIGAAAEQLGLMKAADFVAAARNPALIRDLDPSAPTLEGYLFPNT